MYLCVCRVLKPERPYSRPPCGSFCTAQVAPTTVTRTATIAAGAADTIQVPGATVAANSLFYVHVQCAGASTETDYTVLFNQGSAPSAGSSIQGVQTVFWSGIGTPLVQATRGASSLSRFNFEPFAVHFRYNILFSLKFF